MWYPDPYRFAHKGTELPFNITFSYIGRSLKVPVTWGALVCATFSLTECAVEQMRDEHKESTYVNASIAGAVTGALMASMTRRIDYMCSSAFCTGILMGLVDYYGPFIQAKAYHIEQNWIPTIAPGENESETVKGLKEKYPEYREL
jgi:glycerol uptake facilitator-like aquaporin